MKIFLTGATGFVGSHIARRLLHDGHELYVLIRPGRPAGRINDLRDSLQVVAGDLARPQELQPQLERIRPDVCVHAAWQIEPKKYFESLENLQWLAYSWQLVQLLADLDCPWFIGIGSSLEYGTAGGYVSERSAATPRGLYGACKLALYFILDQLCRLRGMRLTWLRLFYPYGPHDYGWRLIPSVIHAVLQGEKARVTKGQQVGDFLYVEDMAAAVGAVVHHQVAGIINVGSGTPVTVEAVVQEIGRLTGRQDLIEFGALGYPTDESMFICADTERLRNRTQWKPRSSLQAGLRQTIAWSQSQLDGDAGNTRNGG